MREKPTWTAFYILTLARSGKFEMREGRDPNRLHRVIGSWSERGGKLTLQVNTVMTADGEPYSVSDRYVCELSDGVLRIDQIRENGGVGSKYSGFRE